MAALACYAKLRTPLATAHRGLTQALDHKGNIMEGLLKSTLAGTASGVLTGYVAVPALAATAAIAMPPGSPIAL